MNRGPDFIQVENLSIRYGEVQAVRNLSFSLAKKSTLGVIGESGSGKTSLAMALMRLMDRKNIGSESTFLMDGTDLFKLDSKEMIPFRKKMQMVFQDPFSSFNPRMKIGTALREGLEIQHWENRHHREEAVRAILKKTGIPADAETRYPHEFSGGQRQRLALARALVLKPEFLILDEPVSALDVSVSAQILNLLKDLKEELGLTYLLIAHDLGIVDYFCDEILVLYRGELMESGTRELLKNPVHPYTRLLLESIPGSEPTNHPDPSRAEENSLCPFFSRCPERQKKCSEYQGKLFSPNPQRKTTCILAK